MYITFATNTLVRPFRIFQIFPTCKQVSKLYSTTVVYFIPKFVNF